MKYTLEFRHKTRWINWMALAEPPCSMSEALELAERKRLQYADYEWRIVGEVIETAGSIIDDDGE